MRYPVDMTVFHEKWINPEEITPKEVVEKTIVTDYSLEIGEGAVIMGSIKSSRHIYIHQGARINGNVIADGVIILDQNARILGTAFSQDSILVGPGAEIGVPPRLKSLIARKYIALCETARVFGYVGCEVDSVTIAADAFLSELRQKRWLAKTQLMQDEISLEMFEKGRSPIAKPAIEDLDAEEEVDNLFDE